jgi:bifunctional DNA-binding transcriptional regulator/antitoxin component of YhaV-PrlF toxin-antitoxin module
MYLVRIKGKYQITIPLDLRERLDLELADFLEAGVEDGRLTFTPKRLADRDPTAATASFSSDPEANT